MSAQVWRIIIGVATSVMAAIMVSALAYAYAYSQSDYPPLAGVARVIAAEARTQQAVMLLGDKIDAGYIETSILGMWRNYCESARAGSRDNALDYASKGAALQVRYQIITGRQYPWPTCPP